MRHLFHFRNWPESSYDQPLPSHLTHEEVDRPWTPTADGDRYEASTAPIHTTGSCVAKNSCVQWEVISTSTKCDCITCCYYTLLQEAIERLAKILQPLTWFHLSWTHQPSLVPTKVNPGVHTLTFCWTTGPNNQAVRRLVAQWWLSHDDVSGIINHHLRLQLFILRKAVWCTLKDMLLGLNQNTDRNLLNKNEQSTCIAPRPRQSKPHSFNSLPDNVCEGVQVQSGEQHQICHPSPSRCEIQLSHRTSIWSKWLRCQARASDFLPQWLYCHCLKIFNQSYDSWIN